MDQCNKMQLILKLCATAFLLNNLWDYVITDAKPLLTKIMKGKLHRYKRDLDLLVECDLQCLQEEDIKDYELIIEYEYGPDEDEPNNFYSNDDNKKCSYACKILDIEKVDDSGSVVPGEISISFEDELLGGFKTNIELSSTSSTTSTPEISTTRSTNSSETSSKSILSTTIGTKSIESHFRKLVDSPDQLLKQCLALFDAFKSQIFQNSSGHPCSYFDNNVTRTTTLISNDTSSPTVTEYTTQLENSSLLVSYPVEPVATTVSSLTLTPTPVLDSNISLAMKLETMPDVSQDIGLRFLPADRSIGLGRTPTTPAPKRVIPKVIRYTVVEAEMAEEESDDNSGSGPEVVELHKIDPEVIKLVDSSMSHISSGLASIKNISKNLPLMNQYELRKTEPKVDSYYNTSDPSRIKFTENIPQANDDQLVTTDHLDPLNNLKSDVEITTQPFTNHTTARTTPQTEDTLLSTKRSVSLETERTSSTKSTSYTVVPVFISHESNFARQPAILDHSSFDFPYVPFNQNISRGHFTRNKTRTVITSQNITSVQTNHTFEVYAYALINDDISTTSTSQTSEDIGVMKTSIGIPKANTRYVDEANFAPMKSNSRENNQSSLNINDGTITNIRLGGINLRPPSPTSVKPSVHYMPEEVISAKPSSAQAVTLINVEGSIKVTEDEIHPITQIPNVGRMRVITGETSPNPLIIGPVIPSNNKTARPIADDEVSQPEGVVPETVNSTIKINHNVKTASSLEKRRNITDDKGIIRPPESVVISEATNSTLEINDSVKTTRPSEKTINVDNDKDIQPFKESMLTEATNLATEENDNPKTTYPLEKPRNVTYDKGFQNPPESFTNAATNSTLEIYDRVKAANILEDPRNVIDNEGIQRPLENLFTEHTNSTIKMNLNDKSASLLEKPLIITVDKGTQRPPESVATEATIEIGMDRTQYIAENITSNFSPALNVNEEKIINDSATDVLGSSSEQYETSSENRFIFNATKILPVESLRSPENNTGYARETYLKDALTESNFTSNSSSPSSERDFTFNGKFNAKDNSSYLNHLKNALMENLKKVDNASVVVGLEKDGDTTKKKEY